MSIIVGTGIVVLNPSSHVLAGQRANSLLWGLPGGRLEYGETILACAQRELREETGLDLPISTFKIYQVVNCRRPGHHSVDFTVVTVLGDGQVPVNREPEKCLGWTWKSWAELRSLPTYWPLEERLNRGLAVTLADYESLTGLSID